MNAISGERSSKGLIRELGKAPDREVAERFELSTSAVRRLRESLSIPSFRAAQALPKAAFKLLGALSDEDIAKMFGVRATVVRRKRRALKIPAKPREPKPLPSTLLAILRDRALTTAQKASKLGYGVQYVTVLMRQHGIASDDPRTGRPRKPVPPELDGLLGRLSDSDIARQLGVTRRTVSLRRQELGISAYVKVRESTV